MFYNYEIPEIINKTKEIRKNIIMMNAYAKGGHTGSDLSEADILASLFFRVLQIPISDKHDYGDNTFIQSKGHGVGGFYATLAAMGVLKQEDLKTYLSFNSFLPGHPVKTKQPFINLNTGGLGHGLPVAVGMAIGKKKKGADGVVYVLTGDGELQEGSNWEAAMAASRFGLDNLVVIVDRNRLQLADKTESIMGLEPLCEKWEAFGLEVLSLDGNNVAEIVSGLESLDHRNGVPKVVIANTVKGKGISFMENVPEWHHKYPDNKQLKQALLEIAE